MRRIPGWMAMVMVAGPALAGADVVLKSDQDVLGNKITYPGGQAEITSVVAVLKPGGAMAGTATRCQPLAWYGPVN